MRLAAIVSALVVFSAQQARAAPEPNDVTRATIDAAAAEYDLGHFTTALELFEKAYRVRHVPALLFNIAQCHRMLGRLKEAATLYRSFLNKEPEGRFTTKAEELLAQVEAALARQVDAQRAPPTGVTPREESSTPAHEAAPPAPPTVLVVLPPAQPAPARAEPGPAAAPEPVNDNETPLRWDY